MKYILLLILIFSLSANPVNARPADGSGTPDSLPKDTQGRVILQCGGAPVPTDAIVSDNTPPLTQDCTRPFTADLPGQKSVGPADSGADQIRRVRETQDSQIQSNVGGASALPTFSLAEEKYQQSQTVTQAGFALRPRLATEKVGVTAKMRVDVPYIVSAPPTQRVTDFYSEFNQPSNQACPYMDVRHHKQNDNSGYYYDYIELISICTGTGVVFDLADPYTTNHYVRNNGAANITLAQIVGTSTNCWNSYIYDYQGQYWYTLMVSCGTSGVSSGASDFIGFGLDPDYCPTIPLGQVFNAQILKFGNFSPVQQTDVLHNQSGTCGPSKVFSSAFDSFGMNWTLNN